MSHTIQAARGIGLSLEFDGRSVYSVLRTNVLGVPAAPWPVIVAGYPAGGAIGGTLSYTDTTATISPAFYKVSSP